MLSAILGVGGVGAICVGCRRDAEGSTALEKSFYAQSLGGVGNVAPLMSRAARSRKG